MDEIFRKSDIALYEAQNRGRGKVFEFSFKIQNSSRSRKVGNTRTLRVSSDAALSIRARTWCGKYAASEDLCTCDIPFAKVKQKSLDLHPSLLRLRERRARRNRHI